MSSDVNYQVKASIFRAYLKWLEREGKLEAALGRVPPSTAQLIRTPPLASTWMPSRPLDDVVEQIEALTGLEGVKRAGEDILRDQMLPMMTPMVRNILRIIGGTPATIYRHWNDLIRTVMRDVAWTWQPTSETAGNMTVTYIGATGTVRMRTFCSGLAGLEQALVMAGTKGVVSDPVPISDNAARFEIRWAK